MEGMTRDAALSIEDVWGFQHPLWTTYRLLHRREASSGLTRAFCATVQGQNSHLAQSVQALSGLAQESLDHSFSHTCSLSCESDMYAISAKLLHHVLASPASRLDQYVEICCHPC